MSHPLYFSKFIWHHHLFCPDLNQLKLGRNQLTKLYFLYKLIIFSNRRSLWVTFTSWILFKIIFFNGYLSCKATNLKLEDFFVPLNIYFHCLKLSANMDRTVNLPFKLHMCARGDLWKTLASVFQVLHTKKNSSMVHTK